MLSSDRISTLLIFCTCLQSMCTLSLPEHATRQSSESGVFSNEYTEKDDDATTIPTPFPDYSEKDEMFRNCPSFELDPGDYVMYENGTAYVEAYQRSYNSSFYRLVNGQLLVCVPIEEDNSTTHAEDHDSSVKFSSSFEYVTVIGLSISCLCLFLHLIVFLILPELRNLPGCYTASLSASLLLGYVFFVTSHMELIKGSKIPCVLFAVLIQYFFLSSFLWSSAIAFDVFKTFLRATRQLRQASTQFRTRRYSIYCLYAWGTPIIFVTVTLVLDNVEGVPLDFVPMIGHEMCWISQRSALLLLFAAPTFTVIAINALFFALSAFIIFSNRLKITEAVHRQMLKRNFIIYLRLAVIMGLTWITGAIASSVDAIWVWYVFAVLNTLQGLFIFIAFTCSKKVRGYLREKFSTRNRKISCQSSSLPTFQSYFNNENKMPPEYGNEIDDSPLTMKKVNSLTDECQSPSLPTFQSYCNNAFSSENEKPPEYGKELDGSPLTMKKGNSSTEECQNSSLQTFQPYFNSAFSTENLEKPPEYEDKKLDGSPLTKKRLNSLTDESF